MKKMNVTEMQNVVAGGYKCSGCGKKFYKQFLFKVWIFKFYTNPKDDCLLHIMTSNHSRAKATWCW